MRVAVITGGGGAMGVACARRLAHRYRLLLADVDEPRLRAVVADLATEGIDAASLPLDVTRVESVHALVDGCVALGDLGALVHTAGLSPTMAPGEKIWTVNLVGTAHLMEAFRPLAGPGRAAVLIASQAGHLARAGAHPELEALVDAPLASGLLARAKEQALLEPGAAYAASKYGVMRLAVREAFAWGAHGGRVVSLSPGIIDTGMGRQELAAHPVMEQMIEGGALVRMGTAEEIADVVDFLCSERASFLTGTDVLVDGGSTAGLLRADR